ncbi:Osmotin, thaumatin-like protein [Trichodelitschia bisporula]|uniref:Osmotin, thaumatin-like protein n=1 Tax=Trichodelitschia bisporula TaxID=703511 RepID=A0A6G1HK93_9PEZI|nr:Osmotin, thaumatin-like protein [Trichodelitschia bisporula]
MMNPSTNAPSSVSIRSAVDKDSKNLSLSQASYQQISNMRLSLISSAITLITDFTTATFLTPITTSSLLAISILAILSPSNSLHHMLTSPRRLDADPKPLVVTNMCPSSLWPGIDTQSGTGPSPPGFSLAPQSSSNLTVSADWQGRVWARTNCSFNSDGTGPANNALGKACGTGDCNGLLACKSGGDTPATLAEFTLSGSDGKAYYDISLVDGYNVPLAILLLPSSVLGLSPNLTNPACVASPALLASTPFDPYNGGQTFLGTNSSCALPFDTTVTEQQVNEWCPWDLQVDVPKGPSDGVYTYPDASVQRPPFNACFSACAKWNKPEDCCTGSHGSPGTCSPSDYSKAAKSVCPDGYSYAFDDKTSTFIVPGGAAFEVVFCPGGRSTNILSAEKDSVHDLGGGQVTFGNGQHSVRVVSERVESRATKHTVEWAVLALAAMAVGFAVP